MRDSRDLQTDLDYIRSLNIRENVPIQIMGIDMPIVDEWLTRAIKAEAKVERLRKIIGSGIETEQIKHSIMMDALEKNLKLETENSKLLTMAETLKHIAGFCDKELDQPLIHPRDSFYQCMELIRDLAKEALGGM